MELACLIQPSKDGNRTFLNQSQSWQTKNCDTLNLGLRGERGNYEKENTEAGITISKLVGGVQQR